MKHDLTRIQFHMGNVLEQFKLDGRSALVIGGSKGLGQAMALALSAAGADVCVVARTKKKLSDTAAAINETGSKGSFIIADVTVEKQVEKMVQSVVDLFGKIDILVNSQGTVSLCAAVDFTESDWQKVMDVNLKSVFLCCKHVGRHMLKAGYGRIINISSVRGFQGRAQDLAYAPSKGAVNQLTRSLAIEWGIKGITVNAIAPTFTRSSISEPFLESSKKKNWVLQRIPMGRLGEVYDLVGPVIFLASEASKFVNGHVLPVEGGWLSA